jgi:beta-glucosidase
MEHRMPARPLSVNTPSRHAAFRVSALSLLLSIAAQAQPPAESPDARIDSLLAQMTLKEKVGQLHQMWGGVPHDKDDTKRKDALDKMFSAAREGRAGTFLGGGDAAHFEELQHAAIEGTRLHIPALFAHDVIHGYRTIFPIPLAQSCSWDLDLIERAEAIAAKEARASGLRWTFAPMVDIARDPRWGRIAEGAGEDPYLGSQIAIARVKGFQGADMAAPDRVMACAKHFAAYGACEGGRDYNTVDLSFDTLYNVYLRPFHAASDAGVGSFMTSFNEINGVPSSGNPFLLRTVLRDQWRSSAVVVSDHSAINEMVAHGYAADRADAARLALFAGTDIDMVTGVYDEHLANLVEKNVVPIELVNESVRRVLLAKQRVGLFDHPYEDAKREESVMLTPEHRQASRELARESIVLLKNDKSALPLSSSMKKIAVVGPLADSARDMIGSWGGEGRAEDTVSALAGLRGAATSKFTIDYEPGCAIDAETPGALDRAAALARQSDIVIAVVGEEEEMSGEGHSRSLIRIPPAQQKLLEAVKATNRPLIAVVMTGRPLAVSWLAENADAIVIAWHLGTEGGAALADILTGDANPSGRLSTTWPRNTGQIPIYYNHKPTGRPFDDNNRYTSRYMDVASTPLYPFGYGLSYTTFAFSPVRAAAASLDATGTIALEVDVSNTGDRVGSEVVQWYFRDPVASRTRPVAELFAFSRITLQPGKSRTVHLDVPASCFAFLNDHGQPVIEPGEIRIHAAGGNVRTPDLSITITTTGK